MEGWQIGLIAVLVVGVAVIVFGALKDRRPNGRRVLELQAPPARIIPRLTPGSPSPHHLSELQARRPPNSAESTALTPEERAELQTAIDSPGVTTIRAGYASRDLVTDQPTGWSVLRHPAVLVSTEPITTIRELLGAPERQLPTPRPLVVVAPALSEELIGTFEVNHIRQLLTVLPVVIPDDPGALRQIAEITGATPMSRTDLQAGYVPPHALGSCATWIAAPDRSYLLPDATHSAA